MIYFDNNATTPLDPRVIHAMQEACLIEGNPSSIHASGKKAKELLTKARLDIATFLQVTPKSILFTSGGTESINLLIRGFYTASQPRHIITSNTEHVSVFHTLESLEKTGTLVSYLPSGPVGAVSVDQIESHILPQTKLIVLSAVNSETGVKIDIDEIARLAHKHRIAFIVDGVALLGKELFTIPEGVSAMAFSGHKFHGPKGTGIAYIAPTFPLAPLFTGGGQEYGYRSGTENLIGIAGLAESVRLLTEMLPSATMHMAHLRDTLEKELKKIFPQLLINGTGPRIANTSNLCFPGIDGETLLIQLDLAGVAVSLGSACASGGLEPSRVLLNMGLSPKQAISSLRFSFSRFNTQEEVHICLEHLRRFCPAPWQP